MEMQNCKCGSDRILKCKDSTIIPNKYWCECLDCGSIGGVVFSNRKFNQKTILQDGTEIIHSPENDAIQKWNEEVNTY